MANGVYSLILFCQHIAYSESELQCQGQRLEGKAVPIPDPGRRAFQEESKNQELRILTFAGGLPLSYNLGNKNLFQHRTDSIDLKYLL